MNATSPVRRRAINRLKALEANNKPDSIEPVEMVERKHTLPELPKFEVKVPFKDFVAKIRNKR